ncbi:MAG TPA: transcriptional regulator [Ornithinibacter sp.]|nr:transcriptional regulator [Ornithinibacter sp.]
MKRDGWTFLTNHGHVLVCLAVDPEVLLRDVAKSIGITERAVQQIVGDLEHAGVLIRLRVGRRHRYVVRRDELFRHPVEAGVTIGDFVDLVERSRACPRRKPPPRALASGPAAEAPSSVIDWVPDGREAARRRPPPR